MELHKHLVEAPVGTGLAAGMVGSGGRRHNQNFGRSHPARTAVAVDILLGLGTHTAAVDADDNRCVGILHRLLKNVWRRKEKTLFGI